MMATPRSAPYIWVTWLARVMAGSVACHWQYWFQAHHKLSQRQHANFDVTAWTVAHSRLLTELRQELRNQGYFPRAEVPFSVDLPIPLSSSVDDVPLTLDVRVAGKIDCLVETDDEVVVFDCKTGAPREADRVQVMIYMHALRQYPQFVERPMRGVVVYPDQRVPVDAPTEVFADHLTYFVRLLVTEEPALREPGPDCRFCSLTALDCDERVEDPAMA